jgi:starvation-inducible DNA-binding protein
MLSTPAPYIFHAHVSSITDHRRAIAEFDDLDLVSQDVLIAQAEQLEMFQWFVRAHLVDSSGNLGHGGAATEQEAADSVG